MRDPTPEERRAFVRAELEALESDKRRLASRCLQLRAALGAVRDLAEAGYSDMADAKEACRLIRDACDEQASMSWADADPPKPAIYVDADVLSSDLARCVIVIAANGGMPDSFWATDSRIALATQTMGMPYEEAREWAREHSDWSPNEQGDKT